MSSSVLFVWRHNNDFDSTLPVVHRMATCGAVDRVVVYVSSAELLWADDFRIDVLRGLPNVEIFDVWSLVGGRIGAAMRALCHRSKMSRGPLRKLLPKLVARVVAGSRWRERLAERLADLAPALVAFDWVDPSTTNDRKGPWGIAEIAAWARDHARPTVALLHGLSLADFPAEPAVLSRTFTHLYTESDHHRAALIAKGYDPTNLIVTGAPRFDPDWVALLDRVLAERGLTRGRTPGVTTVVFFATKLVYDFDFERVVDWLDLVAGLPGVRLIVQPHPRGQGKSRFRRLTRHASCVIDMETPAAILMRDADVVSTLVSSVVCEAIVMGRPLLYPRFLNTLSTRFDEEGACVVAGSMEETAAALTACVESGVPAEAYARFLAHHVTGGHASPIAVTIDDMRALIAEA